MTHLSTGTSAPSPDRTLEQGLTEIFYIARRAQVHLHKVEGTPSDNVVDLRAGILSENCRRRQGAGTECRWQMSGLFLFEALICVIMKMDFK